MYKYKVKKAVSSFVLCALILSLCACGKENTDRAAVYEKTIGGLADDELFVLIDTNAPLPVLLVTSQVYDDGTGKQASISCDVYYPAGKEVKRIGTIESTGTAYPVSYDETGIYAASGHGMQRFEIEESGILKPAEGIYEQFDENGEAAYTRETEKGAETISEEEYYTAYEKYSNAAVAGFSYGASDAFQ